MNLYTLFEDSENKKVKEDFNGLQYGVQENDGLSGSLSTDNGVAAVQGTDNDISPIGSGYNEQVTEDNPTELDEVAMNPTAFAQAISSGAEKGVLVGFEFETLIPKAAVMTWKNGPTPIPVGYDPNSLAWIEGKTTNDLLDGILRAMPNNSNRNEKVLDDLFKYKTSVQGTVGHKSIWSHYRQWVDQQVRQELEAEAATGVSPVIASLKELLKDRAWGAQVVGFMDASGEREYGSDEQGNPNNIKAKPFVLRVLKDKTGIDFSGRVKKSELTPEVILKIKDAMQYCYRITRGPVDTRCSQVSNAADGRRDALYSNYVPGWSYNHQSTPESVELFKNHFAQFCTATMGTDNLKELLKTKWAFKGRVNNTTDTLKEKLWYYVTPGATEPASLQQRSRYTSTDYMDGAEFLKANLKDVYGDNMVIFRGYHQDTKKLDRWYIEPDGSLRPNQGDYAAEVVSPPLKADAAMTALRTWYEKARALNLYTNNSTGLHINVSIPDKIDVLKLAVFAGDQHVLKQFGREDNSYARSVIKSLKNQGSLPTVGSGSFKEAEKQMKELVRNISGDHFATVNFNGKYVSFRHAGGNYLGKPEDIANTVGRFVRAMILAADPAAHRDEYIGKLVKLMKTPAGAQSDKLSLTDIRSIAERGIPVQYIDFVTTVGSTPEEAQAAAEKYVRENFTGGTGANNIVVQNDPSARERLAQDRGFGDVSKNHIRTTGPENFFRATIYPTTRRSLNVSADRFTTQGTDRGSAFGMYGNGHNKHAVGIRSMNVIKPTDPGYVDAVKALRGEQSKPLPLPGSKAAPKARAARFASQQPAGQEPAAQQPAQTAQQYGIWHTRDNHWVENGYGRISSDNPNAVLDFMNAHNLANNNYQMRPIPASQQAQPSSDDESEPAGDSGGQQWELYHVNSGEAILLNNRPVTFTADRLSHAQDAMAAWMRERGRSGNGYNVRPVSDGDDGDYEESGTDARDTYRFVNADTGRVLDTEQGLSEESALERAEELVRQYNVEVVVYNYRDQEVERINPDELDDDDSGNAREHWTLNNGEMVRHYDPSQVNSERAFELAREMYSQYSRPVTISRDGTTYGHWPREEQQADGYHVVDSSGRVIGQTHATEDDALEAAQYLADLRRGTYYVNDPEGHRVGGARPDESDDSDEDDELEDDGSTLYRFVNMEDGELLATEHYASNSEAFVNAQELANNEGITVEVGHGANYTPLRRFTPDQQEQEQRFTLDTDTAQQVVVTRGAEDAQQHALSMANERGETVRVLNAVGGVVATVAPAQRQGTQTRPQFYRFMNPSNRNAVGAGYYSTDQEAEAHAQRIANAVHGEILLLGVTPTGPDRRLGTFQPQVNEARIFHADEKVNVVYNPQNSDKKVIVAKAVDHAMADKVIRTYLHRNAKNAALQKLNANDFYLQPISHYTSEGITSPGGSTTDDSTSPIHGTNAKIADRYDPEDFDAMVTRVGQKARAQEKRQPVDLAKLAQRLRQADTRNTMTDEDIMESRIDAMKRAGYDFL